MLKSKISGAVINDVRLEYEGSLTLDADLLEAADILPNEQVHVLNRNSGVRFVTYAIRGRRRSGIVRLNGPAARLGLPGDRIVVLAYAVAPDGRPPKPRIIRLDLRDRRRRGR